MSKFVRFRIKSGHAGGCASPCLVGYVTADAYAGEIIEQLAGVEDYLLAEAVWRAAIALWPDAAIILRQGARVVHDSRRLWVVK